jgi:hypothetical protein
MIIFQYFIGANSLLNLVQVMGDIKLVVYTEMYCRPMGGIIL